MHDPMVVAHEIPSPFPHRVTWREGQGRRWGFDISRRTNAADLGKRTYPWWRPKGYTLRLAGRAYGLSRAVTIWHVEPGGRDAFTVCKHASRWKWHVRHWSLQIHALGWIRGRFTRCAECGRRFRRKDPRMGYWDGKDTFHNECMSLRHVQGQLNDITKYVQAEADQTTRWRVEHRLKNLDEKATSTSSAE